MLDSFYLTATTVMMEQGIVRAVAALPDVFRVVDCDRITGYFGECREVTISSIYLEYEFGGTGQYIVISRGPASDAEPGERLEVTFACGHTADLPTPGHASGASYQTGAATGLCRECWSREQLAPAVAHAHEHQLPKLRGSKAQQQWAMSIRHRMLLDVWSGPDPTLNQRRWAAAKKLAAIPYAGWWIGHREHPVADLLSDMMSQRLDTRPRPTFRGPHGADVYFNSLK